MQFYAENICLFIQLAKRKEAERYKLLCLNLDMVT